MRRAVIAALLVGVPFGVIAAAGNDSIAMGIAVGVGLGAAMGAYVGWSNRRWTRWVASVAAEFEPEGILHQGDAAFGVGSQLSLSLLRILSRSSVRGSRGGRLVLTKQRLVFVPHKHSILGKRAEIALADIVNARPTGDLFPMIALVTASKQVVQITVRKPGEWLAKLRDAKAA